MDFILHQTYKTGNIPKDWIPYRDSWVYNKFDDKWDYRFYLDNNLRNEVRDNFPQFAQLFDAFEKTIERVDFARYSILYRYGGAYADLDMEQKRSLKPLFQVKKALVAYEPVEHSQFLHKRSVVLCNAMMISNARNPYWVSLMEWIANNWEKNKKRMALYTTGPMAMTEHFESIVANNNQFTADGRTYNLWDHFILLPSCTFYPELFDKTKSKLCPESQIYAVHHWSAEWTGWGRGIQNFVKGVVRVWQPVTISLIVLIFVILLGWGIGVSIKYKLLKKKIAINK